MPPSSVSLEHLAWLAAGFCLGVVVCTALARAGARFFTHRLKAVSDEALYHNSNRFMALADQYFSRYSKDVKKDLNAAGSELRQTVEPVRQSLDRYETKLGMMEKDREKAFGSITERLREIGETQMLLQMETGNLVKALRVPHVRGRWGEMTLKRVASLAGMSEYCDFETQKALGSGKGSLRPDMTVTLPGNRQIVIDAKVPLMAYLDALEARDEIERNERMKDHGRQVKKHISDLSSKQYFASLQPSPEFTVLFIPGENFFSAALTVYPDLIEQGIDKGVVLATPTTLIALLKAVAYSWQQQAGYENAREIQMVGKELFSRLRSMAGNINQLGKEIEQAVAAYNRTVGAMESRVMSSARKLGALELSSQSLETLQPVDEFKSSPKEFLKSTHDEE